MGDIYDARNQRVGSRGEEAGKDAKYNDIQRKKWEDDYHKSQGATGIAGAGKRSTPDYKKKQAEAWGKASASGWGNK
jgi:hypothetical protein